MNLIDMAIEESAPPNRSWTRKLTDQQMQEFRELVIAYSTGRVKSKSGAHRAICKAWPDIKPSYSAFRSAFDAILIEIGADV